VKPGGKLLERISQFTGSASAAKTLFVGVKVIVSERESLSRALRAFHAECRRYGIRTGEYVRLADRNRRKDYYEKPGTRRRRKRSIAQYHRRRGERGFA
jgi:ribosomal protein S21